LSTHEINKIKQLVSSRKHIKRGEKLYSTGSVFNSIYIVHSGFLKSYVITQDGRDQVTGFQMAGEILGLDGIETERYRLNASALEDSEVCIIPFSRMEEIARRIPRVQHQFHKMMSQEMMRDKNTMTLLGTMCAEERVAVFLLDLSQRYGVRGYAAAKFQLRMTREEIGSYLGLRLETVSRVFSKFQESGLIAIHKKLISILNFNGLKNRLYLS
jgi:CRP/FNR family transcriptional regulator